MMKKLLTVLILGLTVAVINLVTASVIPEANIAEPPVVNVKNGRIRGYAKQLEFENQTVFVYEGIPYGKPPVGELRFKRPLPAEPWSGIYDATHYRNACMFPRGVKPDDALPTGKHMGEDCLFLTVYRPSKESSAKRPVMFWIHGGGFETGTAFSTAYDGSYLATIGDVVVVAINYRLGAFGFLYAGIDDAPGNMGLYDQILALKWVRDNIENFGGDPNMVTIFGESAGSMSTSALIMAPEAKGLFHRGIMMSGALNSYLGSNSKEHSLEKAKSVMKRFNCQRETMKESIACMRTVPAQTIVDKCRDALVNDEAMVPTYESDLLPLPPVKALKSGNFTKNLDLMFGVVRDEGAIFTSIFFPSYMSPFIKHPDLTLDKTKALLEIMFQLFKTDFGKKVAEYYTKNLNDSSDVDEMRVAIANSFGDYHLVCPTMLFGQHYGMANPNSNLFSYRVVHPPALSAFVKECSGYMGVCHSDDLVFLFGIPIRLRGILYTEEDYHLAIDMIRAWANFARYGKPGKVAERVEWTSAVDSKHQDFSIRHFSFDVPEHYQMVHNFYVDLCDKFWKPKIFS